MRGGGGDKKSWDQTRNRVFDLVITRQAKHFYRKRNDPGRRSGADCGRKFEVVELSLGGSFGHESNTLVSPLPLSAQTLHKFDYGSRFECSPELLTTQLLRV